MAAPKASVASMVLVMVFSLLKSNDGVSFKTSYFRIYSRIAAGSLKFPASLSSAREAILSYDKRTLTDC